MAQVELTETAIEDLHWLIRTHSLPEDTRAGCVASSGTLSSSFDSDQSCTAGGRALASSSARGGWKLVIYQHDEPNDRCVIVTIQDARSSSAATSQS